MERERIARRIAYGCLALVLLGVALFIGWVLWSMGHLAGYW